MTPTRVFILFACTCFFPFFVGCSGSGPEMGNVTGRITLDGNPVVQATICFHPSDGRAASAGISDANGKYTLLFSESRKGAMIGEHKVTISTFRPETTGDREGEFNPAVQESIPAKFTSPNTTDLIREVKKGRQVFDFDLSS